MEKVNLYTRQDARSLDEIKKEGRMTNKEKYVEENMLDVSSFFISKYRRFVKMAEEMVPRPQGIEYPVWCSVSKDNCLDALEGSLVYCLRVPKDHVIYFSSHKWDYVLNDLYIPIDDEDERAFDEEVKRLGVENKYHFIEGKYAGFFPHIERKIEDSWDRIFIIDEWNEYAVQANLWEIREEWIQHIVYPGENIYDIARDMTDDLEGHRQAYEDQES